MKESVANDFSKYQHSIEQLYKQRSVKRLGIDGILVCLLLISLGVVPMFLKVLLFVLLAPLIIIDTYRNVLVARNCQGFIDDLKIAWQGKIEGADWADPETIVYEDDNNYFVKDEEQWGISKKGSRTLPSEIRGLSLIIGENNNLFSKEQPIFVVYCDTTEIKHIDLNKKNEAILKNMQWTRVKNKVLRPLGVGIIVIVVLLYFLRII
ncbi:hypothetical protein [uncultured Vagococcus sp.]|uniref:hypothetical protein n=1 Tax=uncultured Vagococcus sp. TaxID=189676 RepID=UPI0028D13805|nr:hypothetical protein [uncultured Vagococcus sp.]